ncbi:DUF1450 domain-containing protein [Paenibacillus sp. GD4]|uniref:DUF1450 domain-containing protein n=2 Tax=Paenibacillus TaxID=44249 RepID=UPI00279689A2|nr:DUF1450 domain-containing protein [Paenibacillus sp. GD4]MDQ1911829.1 DUF1450 domain-containing protein [Paenibacillus sp. GD4]
MRSIIIWNNGYFLKEGLPSMKKIKYCCKNWKQGTKSVYRTMKEQYPDLKQKKKDCLGNCRMCSKQCFVKIGKKDTICAMSPEELYEKLSALLKSS